MRAPTLSGGCFKKSGAMNVLLTHLQSAFFQKLKLGEASTPLLQGISHHPVKKK